MTPAQFVNTFLSEAQLCAAGTGLNPCLFLAQWADETGWGTSRAFSVCKNLAGINPFDGYADCDGYAQFSSYTQSAQAEVEVLHNGLYGGVLATAGQSFDTQARALGSSPWASGHYNNGGGPGSSLITIYNQDISPYTNCPAGSTPPSPPPPSPPPISVGPSRTFEQAAVGGGLLLLAGGIGLIGWTAMEHPETLRRYRAGLEHEAEKLRHRI